MRQNTFFSKNVLLYTINNISMVFKIIISYFSCILKMMYNNTFPEPQPDSASYLHLHITSANKGGERRAISYFSD